MPSSIAAFNFPEIHEVVGFGCLKEATGRSNELGLVIVLAKVDDPISGALDRSPVIRRVGCGQLMVATIGSRWRDGAYIGRRDFGRPIVGDVSLGKEIVLGDRLAGAAPSALDGVRNMPCYLLKLNSADLSLSWIVVPVAEVVRAIFGASSEFLVQLMGGQRTSLLSPNSGFFHRSLSGRQTSDCFRLACTRSPTDMEAVLAARVLASPDLLEVHDGVFRRRQVAMDGEGSSPLTMAFPSPACAGRTWTLEGDCLPEAPAEEGKPKPYKTFLVRRILRLPFDPPFKLVEVALHRLAPAAGGPPSGRRVGIRSGSPIPGLQEHEPSGGGAGIVEEVDAAVLEPAHGIEVVHLPLADGGAPAPFFSIIGEGDGEVFGSTGDRRPGGRAAHVSLRRDYRLLNDPNDPRDERARSREATWQAVAAAAAAACWPIVHGAARDDGSPHLEKAGTGKRSFDVLLVGIKTSDCDLFVVDAGTEAGDERSVGLLRREDGQRFDAARDLASILTHVANASGKWRGGRKLDGFEVAAISRKPEGVWRTPALFNGMMAARIEHFVRVRSDGSR